MNVLWYQNYTIDVTPTYRVDIYGNLVPGPPYTSPTNTLRYLIDQTVYTGTYISGTLTSSGTIDGVGVVSFENNVIWTGISNIWSGNVVEFFNGGIVLEHTDSQQLYNVSYAIINESIGLYETSAGGKIYWYQNYTIDVVPTYAVDIYGNLVPGPPYTSPTNTLRYLIDQTVYTGTYISGTLTSSGTIDGVGVIGFHNGSIWSGLSNIWSGDAVEFLDSNVVVKHNDSENIYNIAYLDTSQSDGSFSQRGGGGDVDISGTYPILYDSGTQTVSIAPYYLPLSGGVMSGNITTSVSGTNSIGESGTPFSGIWTNNLNGLAIPSGGYQVSGNYALIDGSNQPFTGDINVSGNMTAVNISGAALYQAGVQVVSSGAGVNNITVTKSAATLTVSGSLTPTFTTVFASVFSGTTFSGLNYTIASGGSILPKVSGNGLIGASGTPFSGIWVNQLNGNIIPSGGYQVSGNYALIDGTNQPFTGNLNVSGISPEYRLYASGSDYARLVRVSGNNELDLKNRIGIGASDATGGTITHSGSYTIHTFSTTGTSTFNPVGTQIVEVLVVAGGGGGAALGGGGGGGGVVYHAAKSVTGAQAVTIGAGGAGDTAARTYLKGFNGGNSLFGDITAIGGGGGGGQGFAGNGQDGGSGGGTMPNLAGSGIQGNSGGGTGYGRNGGLGVPAGAASGGGGGGAGSVGVASVGVAGGNGGSGVTFMGLTVGGGGGGGSQGGTGGLGRGGGGNGSGGNTATAGTDGTGGGGGSAGYAGAYGTPKKGGDGIVVVRYIPAASLFEHTVLLSKDSAVAGEAGVAVFGPDSAATHLNGGNLYFDINGVNKGTLNSAGSLAVSGDIYSPASISGLTIYQNGLQVVNSGIGINNITASQSAGTLTVSGSLTPTFTTVNSSVFSGTTFSGVTGSFSTSVSGLSVLGTNATISNTIFASVLSGTTLYGSHIMAVTSVSGVDYSALTTDCYINVDTTGGNRVITLPTASGNSGKSYHIRKTTSDGYQVIVSGTSGQTINGATTKEIVYQYSSMQVISNNTNWGIN